MHPLCSVPTLCVHLCMPVGLWLFLLIFKTVVLKFLTGAFCLNREMKPENGGMPITQYTIIPNPAVPPCGNYCHADASVRQFHFGPLNHSQTYNFAVHADNCGGTQEGRLSNLTVFFGGTVCNNCAELILRAIQFPQHEWMIRDRQINWQPLSPQFFCNKGNHSVVRTTNQFVQCMLFDDSLFYPTYFAVPSQAAINHHLFLYWFSFDFLPYSRPWWSKRDQHLSCVWQRWVAADKCFLAGSGESFSPRMTLCALIRCKGEGFDLVTPVSYLFCIIEYSGVPLPALHSRQWLENLLVNVMRVCFASEIV